jgi:fatty acid kinase fatty acid binding subunit
MAVRVLTDSTAYFSPGEAEALSVTVVPLYVIFGDQTYRDGVDLTIDDFFRLLVESQDLPRTSQPSAGDFEQAYRRLAETTDEIVAVHLSSHISGTLNTSAMAATALSGNPKIEVVDSKAISVGQAWVVRAAVEAAQSGLGLAEVAAAAHRVADSIRTLVAIDTLEYLRRGGRLGRTQAFLGSALDVKPILGLEEGQIVQLGRVRTRRKSVDRLIELASEARHPKRFAVADATTPAEAQELRQRLERAFPAIPVEVGRAGPVIGVHAGPGMLGIQVMEGDEPT